MQDKLFKVLLILSAIVIPVIGGGIIYSLTVDASGAFEEFGFWHFIFSDDWVTTAGKESYGALPFITGTLLTTALALLMCIPFSLPVALFTGEYFRGKKIAASAVILSPVSSQKAPQYRGEELVCSQPNTYLRIFGKPATRLNRRMGVVVCYDKNDGDLDALRDKCKSLAAKVEVY